MNAVLFDTLKMARKLQASGMDRAMAQGVVEVVVDVMVETKKATLPVRAGAKTENAATTAEAVRYSGADKSRKACFSAASQDWSVRVRRDFTIQLGGMFVMWVCITIIGFSYLLPHR